MAAIVLVFPLVPRSRLTVCVPTPRTARFPILASPFPYPTKSWKSRSPDINPPHSPHPTTTEAAPQSSHPRMGAATCYSTQKNWEKIPVLRQDLPILPPADCKPVPGVAQWSLPLFWPLPGCLHRGLCLYFCPQLSSAPKRNFHQCSRAHCLFLGICQELPPSQDNLQSPRQGAWSPDQ